MKRTFIIIAVLVILSLVVQLLYKPLVSSDTLVRVRILKDAKELFIAITGYYKILDADTEASIKEGKDLHKTGIVSSIKGLSLDGEDMSVDRIKIMPSGRGYMYINGRSYRGSIDVGKDVNGRLFAINHVDIEWYLKGVLNNEVSHWWPMEALKAQAITARTYALYQMSTRAKKDYDLTNDAYSQVYGGKSSEKWKTSRAVDLTKGKVLMFEDNIFPTYYHAACGGGTEDASNIWDIDIRPLEGPECRFCRYSPHYIWYRKVPLSRIEASLKLAGYDLNGIEDIKVHTKTSTGRIKELMIISDKKKEIIPAGDFRIAVGPNMIRSTKFEIKKAPPADVFFEGHGWGHGVGMCQWGAFFLSLKRYSAREILRYYYPGSEIKHI